MCFFIVKCEKHFIKMLKDVGMTMLKSTGTRYSICRKKPVMMALEIRRSMKAKVRDGEATIITCVTP